MATCLLASLMMECWIQPGHLVLLTVKKSACDSRPGSPALGCWVAVTMMFTGFGNSSSSSAPRVLILASCFDEKNPSTLAHLGNLAFLSFDTETVENFISIHAAINFYPFEHLIFYIYPAISKACYRSESALFCPEEWF